jgi:zinc/manganese transport system substrate-binding protein
MRHPLALIAAVAVTIATPASAKVRVVATIPVLGAIAAEIGGDRVEVDTLAVPGEDPHFVDPRPNLILKLSRADLLIVNGLELEAGWLPPLQASARNGAVQTGARGFLDASGAVRRLEVTGRVDRAAGDIHPGGNPHYLFDARAAAEVADQVARRLGELDPAHSGEYAGRGAVLSAALRDAAAGAAARARGLPAERRRVVPYHRSFPYLNEWLGLEEVATIEPRPGIPPDPAHVSAVLDRMRQTGARVILQEPYYPRKTPDTLARLAGGEVVVVPSDPSGGAAAYYRGLAREVLDALAR